MEGLDQQSALQVALKIIDYERNEYRAVQAFASERSTMTDINSLYARSVRALDLIPAEALKRTAEMSPEEREMAAVLRMYRTMSEAVIRRRKQQQAELAERTDNSDRYFRRASNQLIKALRACSYRPNDQ